MPYLGIHVCTLRSSAKYSEFRVSKCARKGGPKKLCIDHRYGIFKKKGKRTSELQELWFRVSDGWTASAARNYCKKQGGSFGAALKKKKEEVSEMGDVVLGENELFDLLTHRAPVGTMLDVNELEGKAKTAFGKLGLDSDVYVFPVTPSTQALDSYGTRMSGASIRRYEVDALAGVPLMDSHKTGGWFRPPAEQPMGYSFWGELSGDPVDETPLFDLLDKDRKLSVSKIDKGLMDTGLKVSTLDYMLREHYPNGPMKMGTEDAIRSIEGKTTRHISIGFGSTLPDRLTYVCGLCGLPVRSKDCDHMPLVRDEETGLLGFAWVTNSRMMEHSLVWRGATPGAIIGKARRMAGQGKIDGVSLDLLESVFQVRIRPGAVSGPGVDFGREVDMTGIGKREEEVLETEELEEETPEEVASEEAPEEEAPEEAPEETLEEASEEAPEEEVSEEESGDEEEEAALMARLTALEESVSRVLERLEEASDEEDASEEESEEEAEPEEDAPEGDAPEEDSEEAGSEEDAPEEAAPEEVPDEGAQAAPDYVIGLSAEELVTELKEILGRVEAAEQRLTGEVEQDVQIAQAHRADLVEQAVRTRVRAGFKFPADRYRIRLKDMSLEELRNEIDELESVVQRIFVPGRPLARPELLGGAAPSKASGGDDMELYRVTP